MISFEKVFFNYPLKAKNLSIRKEVINGIFGSNIKEGYIEAIKDVSFDLDAGVYGLYGQNGSGKTTLLKLIAGILEPNSGIIRISKPVCSMININFGLNEELTGNENIELKLILEGVKKREQKQLQEKIKIDTGLGNYLELPLKTYSSGMRFRLAFFTSINIKSEILLLDEWIGTADQTLRGQVDELIFKKISDTYITIIASHNLERLKKICNKVFIMKDGSLLD